MGWTGGQYSLWRAALGVTIALESLAAIRSSGSSRELVAGLVLLSLGMALAVGWRDRLAAFVLVPLVGWIVVSRSALISLPPLLDPTAMRDSGLLFCLISMHCFVPAAPFGALDARDRVDPRGGWQCPREFTDVAWGLLLIAFAARAGQADAPLDSLGFSLVGCVEVSMATVGFFARRLRGSLWLALALLYLADLSAFATFDLAGSHLLLLFAAAEPARWSGRSLRGDRSSTFERSAPPAAGASPAHLFYDGDCGFCHRSVRFILSEELATPAPLRLRFAPLGSETFRERMTHHPELDPASLPDSIVLELEDGTILTRSAAALEIAARLGGFWWLLARIGSWLPGRLLDIGYDAIARVRKRLFATPKDACPILPPDLRARFDP